MPICCRQSREEGEKRGCLSALCVIALGLAGPITYIICVIDTWSDMSSVLWKLFIGLILDIVLATLWPVTWFLSLLLEAFGTRTPITTVLGF